MTKSATATPGSLEGTVRTCQGRNRQLVETSRWSCTFRSCHVAAMRRTSDARRPCDGRTVKIEGSEWSTVTVTCGYMRLHAVTVKIDGSEWSTVTVLTAWKLRRSYLYGA